MMVRSARMPRRDISMMALQWAALCLLGTVLVLGIDQVQQQEISGERVIRALRGSSSFVMLFMLVPLWVDRGLPLLRGICIIVVSILLGLTVSGLALGERLDWFLAMFAVAISGVYAGIFAIWVTVLRWSKLRSARNENA